MSFSVTFVLLVTLASLTPPSHAQGQGKFISPGPQVKAGDYSYALNFHWGQPQTFRWTANVAAVRLALWQEKYLPVNISQPEVVLDAHNNQSAYTWTGKTFQDLGEGHVFFLQMYDAMYAVGAAAPIATSEYFNLSSPPVSSPISSSTSLRLKTDAKFDPTKALTSTTSTSTPASTSDTTSNPTPNPKSDAAGADSQPTSKPNEAVSIGLGAGLGCAVLLAVLAGALLYDKYKKKQAEGAAISKSQYQDSSRKLSQTDHYPYENDKKAISELQSAPAAPHQLPDNSVHMTSPQEKWGWSTGPWRSELE